MTPQHISHLARRSQRIDLPAALIVSIPEGVRHRDCVNEIARVDVDGVSVLFVHQDRHTVRLATIPDPDAVVSLFWCFPGDYCPRLIKYLHSADADVRDLRPVKGCKPNQATTPPPDDYYGLTPPSGPYRRGPQ